MNTSSFSQNEDLFALWTDSTLAHANSANDVNYMSEEEKQIVFYINVCRLNPSVFADTYLQDYLKERNIKNDKEIKALIQELKLTSSMDILAPSEVLTEVARNHAKDMGETGRTGHNSSDGTSFQDRMVKLADRYNGINENANYGLESAIDIVVDLLIDRDVPNLGHRRNILNREMHYIGVAIEPHKKWEFNCVQDFGGKKPS